VALGHVAASAEADGEEAGFVTTDDSWDNRWRVGPNSALGWSPVLGGSGSGAKSLGMELAGSRAFSECQVKKAFRMVCLRDPVDSTDRAKIETMTDNFENGGYVMKPVFAEAATYCMGD